MNRKDTTYVFEKSNDSLVSSLPNMQSYQLDCSADVYWRIIKRGKEAIPVLIESLTDTTLTNVYHRCKHGRLNVGEIAYFALEEIAEFPTFIVTHYKFDVYKKGCWNFYEYLFDNRNKNEYRKMVSDFYDSNKFVYSKFNRNDITDCQRKYEIIGKYILKD